MKSNYGKGCNLPEYKQIFPAETMTGNQFHDYAVYCAMLMAAKFMTRKELEKVADWIPPYIREQVAQTCKRIMRENLGCIIYA